MARTGGCRISPTMTQIVSATCVRSVVTQAYGGKSSRVTARARVPHSGASRFSSSHRVNASWSDDSSTSGYAEDTPSIGDIVSLMNAAIEAEDFENAAIYRDRLKQLKQSTVAEVTNANDLFYEAFRSGSIKKMKAIWGAGEHVQCLHPGAACIGGSDSVLQSWDIVFSSLPPGAQLEIGVEQTRVHADDTMGFVTCVENVKGDDGVGTLACTNVFEKQQGEWKIIHHHAHGINGIR